MLMLQNRQPTTQGRMMMDGASERAREEKQCGVGRAGGEEGGVQDATTRRRREETYAAIQNTHQIGGDWWSVSQEKADATTSVTHSLPHAADTSPARMR